MKPIKPIKPIKTYFLSGEPIYFQKQPIKPIKTYIFNLSDDLKNKNVGDDVHFPLLGQKTVAVQVPHRM